MPCRAISNSGMSRVLSYLLIWLGLAAVMPVQAQVLSPTYVWSWIHPTLSSRHVSVHDHGVMLLCLWGGLSEGPTLDSMKEVLSAEEYARVSRETQFAVLRNGTAIIGSGRYSGVYVRSVGSTEFTWIDHDSTPGPYPLQRVPFLAFEPNGICLPGYWYSSNSGQTWIQALPPDSIRDLEDVSYSESTGFFARAGDRWYSLDMETREWREYDTPRDLRRASFMRDGAVVGWGETSEGERCIRMRSRSTAPWQELRSMVRTDGAAIPIGGGQIFRWDDSTSIILSDAGVVGITDGERITTRSIPEASTHRLKEVDRGDERNLLIKYENGSISSTLMVMLDVRTGMSVTVPSPWGTTVEQNNVFMIDGALAMLDRIGTAWRYDGQYWSPGLCVRKNGAVFQPVKTHFVTSHGGRIFANMEDEIIECGSEIRLRPRLRHLENGAYNRTSEYGPARTLMPTNLGLFSGWNPWANAQSWIGQLNLVENDTMRMILDQPIAAVEWEESGRLLAGGAQLYESADTGRTWRTYDIDPTLHHDSVIFSSIVDLQGGGLLVGQRGYVNTATGKTIPGGILRSQDNGMSWKRVSLPVQGEWVSRIQRIGNHCLLAWVGAVRRDPIAAGTGFFLYSDSSWSILKSCDDGRTWRVTLTIPGPTWGLRYNSTGIAEHGGETAISTPAAIYRSQDFGESWVKVDNLPTATIFGSVAYDSSGALWIGSVTGLFVLNRNGSSGTDVRQYPALPGYSSGISFAPNPFTDVLTLHIDDDLAIASDAELFLMDARGRIVMDLTDELRKAPAGEITLDFSHLATGAYVAVARWPGRTATTMLLKR